MSKFKIVLSCFGLALLFFILLAWSESSSADPIKYGTKVVLTGCNASGTTTVTVPFAGDAVVSAYNETTCICPAATTCSKTAAKSICIPPGGARETFVYSGTASCWSAGGSGEGHIQKEDK